MKNKFDKKLLLTENEEKPNSKYRILERKLLKYLTFSENIYKDNLKEDTEKLHEWQQKLSSLIPYYSKDRGKKIEEKSKNISVIIESEELTREFKNEITPPVLKKRKISLGPDYMVK